MRLNYNNTVGLVLTFVGLSLVYTNCSVMAPAVDSSGSTKTTVNCDAELMKTYSSTVYPFFKQSTTCIGCHIEGGTGLGVFASSTLENSFAAFIGAGFSKVQYMATNPAHKPPYTGIQHQPALDAMAPVWTKAENEHLSCVSKSQNGGVDESLVTAAKAAPSIYSSGNATQTLTWDLDLASDLSPATTRSVPARVTIDVKVLYQLVGGVNTAVGYRFSAPTLLVKVTGQQVVVEGLFFQINNRTITSQTTFTSLSRVVQGNNTTIPLMIGNANTLIQPIGSSDTFALYYRRIATSQETGDATPPLTPILSLQDATTGYTDYARQAEMNTFILRDNGILRWCLSESPTRPASTQDPCSNTTPGTTNGWNLSRPTKFNLSAGNGAKTVYLWVANDSLLLNLSPAQFTITRDSAAPVAATIGSITTGNSQVAAMAVSHPAQGDVAGWCVAERSAVLGAMGTPALNDQCWRWTDLNTKPTTVGFKGSGNRRVVVYVRDQAGNVSLASNAVDAFNAFSAVTFRTLTGDPSDGSSGTIRAVFKNNCALCHSDSTGPGYSKLRLFVYSNGNNDLTALKVAQTGQLVARTNNALSPMPNINNGLMSQEERDIIRLWTMPEGGGDPLP